MKIKPILFSTPMVQATLNGTKTQTRRIIKPIPLPLDHGKVNYKGRELTLNSLVNHAKYQKGDILWVRERYGISKDKYKRRNYKAGDKAGNVYPVEKWKPSIYMPKDACRLWLKITDVSVERLQDITEDDAIAEGIKNGAYAVQPVYSFKMLWQSINGSDSWKANPYVWVYKFERCEMPKNFLS